MANDYLSLRTDFDGLDQVNMSLSTVSLYGYESISQPFWYRVGFDSSYMFLSPADLVGRKVTVSMTVDASNTRYFHGYVKSLTNGSPFTVDTEQRGITYSVDMRRYEVEIVPWFWYLSQKTDCRVFTNLSVPEIVDKIFQEYQNDDSLGHIIPVVNMNNIQGPKQDMVIQYNESDFDFISRLLESEGFFYYFLQDETSHKMVLGSHAGHYKYCGPTSDSTAPTVSYRPSEENAISGNHTSSLYSWDSRYQPFSGRWILDDYDYLDPARNTLLTSESSQMQNSFPGVVDDFEKYDFGQYPVNYTPDANGRIDADTKWVDLRLSGEECQYLTVLAEGGYRWFRPGGKFQFDVRSATTKVPSSEGGQYVVKSVFHHLDLEQKQDTLLANYYVKLECLPAATTFYPPAVTPIPRIHGPVNARVTNASGEINDDELNQPVTGKNNTEQQGLGRVRVRFAFSRVDQTGREREASSWLRVSQLWAGPSYGSMSIPAIGHEVLIEFEDGDLDRPVITHRMYNVNNLPSLAMPDYQDQWVLRDSVGNKIKMRADAASPQIEIYTPKGSDNTSSYLGDQMTSTVTLGSANSNLTSFSIPDVTTTSDAYTLATDSSEDGLNVTTAGELNFSLGTDLNISTSGIIGSVAGNEQLHVSEQRAVYIQGGEIRSLASAQMLEIAATAPLSGGAYQLTIDGDDKLYVKKSRDYSDSSKDYYDLTMYDATKDQPSMGGNRTVRVADAQNIKIGGVYKMVCNGGTHDIRYGDSDHTNDVNYHSYYWFGSLSIFSGINVSITSIMSFEVSLVSLKVSTVLLFKTYFLEFKLLAVKWEFLGAKTDETALDLGKKYFSANAGPTYIDSGLVALKASALSND